jgi:2-polyprenyl-3-methyl-5-hydroxy-6-metoxy-1,4-benzoquinol methylase
VVKHQKNLGYGGNQKAGYRYFIEKGFDIVVLLHGDGQYAPEILSQLYAPIVEGKADAVFGSRMMKTWGGPLKGGMPLYKYAGNRILTTLENRALGMNLTEFHSGYRAYSLHALRQIDFSRMTDDFHFDTEIIIKLNHQHFRIAEVPIPTYYGTEICYVNGMRYARDVVRAVRRYRRTRNSIECAPEFAEYFVHYPIKHMAHSSHSYALRAVGSGREVLDIGCGKGFFAEELSKRGCRVAGVDCVPASAVSTAVSPYFETDLDAGLAHLRQALGGRRFDCVLFMDVLEHQRNPDRLLEEACEFLAPGGLVLVSVPNVANLTVRLMLLAGRFTYAERGILDRTHLRFYTHRTARALLRRSGYEILREMTTVMPVELALGLRETGFAARVLNRLLAPLTWLMPSLFGYQIMLIAKPSPSPGRN